MEISSYKINERILANKGLFNTNIIFYIFVIGTIIFIFVAFIYNHTTHRRMLDTCKLIDEEEILSILSMCKYKTNFSQKILLYKSPYNTSLFSYGVFRPSIVMPNTEFTEEDLKKYFAMNLYI